jgi:hypothetical protein
MIDLIKETWDPSQDFKRQYDNMLKEMLLADGYELIDLTQVVANFVLTLHQHIQSKTKDYANFAVDVDEMKHN